MKLVKLLKYYKGINPGEQAGFEDYEAEHLVAIGAAEYVKPAAPAPAPSDKAPKADAKDSK